MESLFVFLLIGITLPIISSYVLVQVKKEPDNQSNVDALIHKSLPDGKFDKIASKLGRKRYNGDAMRKSAYEKPDSGSYADDILGFVANALSKFLRQANREIHISNDDINPANIQFRSNKPSLMYEVNSESIINVIKNFMNSKNLLRYLDKFSRKAAVVYRSVKDELMRQNYGHNQNYRRMEQ